MRIERPLRRCLRSGGRGTGWRWQRGEEAERERGGEGEEGERRRVTLTPDPFRHAHAHNKLKQHDLPLSILLLALILALIHNHAFTPAEDGRLPQRPRIAAMKRARSHVPFTCLERAYPTQLSKPSPISSPADTRTFQRNFTPSSALPASSAKTLGSKSPRDKGGFQYHDNCRGIEFIWCYKYRCDEIKLLERLVHLSLRTRGAALAPRLCPGCNVRHREFFLDSAAGGIDGLCGIIEFWLGTLGQQIESYLERCIAPKLHPVRRQAAV
ncbi:hypothetical protein FB451DRAFT_1452237 [Mycena latifolia]|nr:hypothetical protein FB451DRAFT_1452237 [Mycena latifolia]